ncbi:MAG TPA: ABC-2 family transporter protein [bacterium]|jgi:ABC-2 type transport system permease protein|nr:ABC-2 family transporter protein [bacterium]
MGFIITLQTRLEYRVDFVLGVLGSIGLQTASLGTLWVLLKSMPVMAGWKPSEIVMIFGVTALVHGTSEIFFNQIWWTPTHLIRGQFDRLLVYPVRSLPFYLVTSPELHSFGNLVSGLVTFSVGARASGLSLWWLLALPYWVACGTLIYTAVLVFAGAAVVHLKGNYQQLFGLVNTLLQNSKFPVVVFPAAVQWLLLVLVPLSLSSFLPVSALTGRLPWLWAWAIPPLAALVLSNLAWKAWDRAFLGYESTGS